MSKEQKRKQLHYRRAEFVNQPGRPLQQLVEEAIRKLTPIRERKESIDDNAAGDSWLRFVNTHRSAMGLELGVMVMLAPGQNRLIIGTDEEKDEVELSRIVPPGDNEFLESLLYYGVKDNHVVILQSLSLRARELENHLNWLLREAGIFDGENMVFLNNFTPEKVYEQLEHTAVKSVRIGADLCSDVDIPDEAVEISESNTKLEPKKIRIKRRDGVGLDLLRVLAPNRIDEISKDIGDTTNIEVFVEVTAEFSLQVHNVALPRRLRKATDSRGTFEAAC